MVKYVPLKDAEISLVEIREDGKPWCKVHGAMNKMTRDGIWRCIASYRYINHPDGRKPTLKENDCLAGCQEEADMV